MRGRGGKRGEEGREREGERGREKGKGRVGWRMRSGGSLRRGGGGGGGEGRSRMWFRDWGKGVSRVCEKGFRVSGFSWGQKPGWTLVYDSSYLADGG